MKTKTNGFVLFLLIVLMSSHLLADNSALEPFHQGELNSSFRVFYSLVFVLVLFFGVVLLYKKYFMKNHLVWKEKEKIIDTVYTHYISPKKSLTIVRVAKEYLLLGVAEDAINLITKVDGQEFSKNKDLNMISTSDAKQNAVAFKTHSGSEIQKESLNGIWQLHEVENAGEKIQFIKKAS